MISKLEHRTRDHQLAISYRSVDRMVLRPHFDGRAPLKCGKIASMGSYLSNQTELRPSHTLKSMLPLSPRTSYQEAVLTVWMYVQRSEWWMVNGSCVSVLWWVRSRTVKSGRVWSTDVMVRVHKCGCVSIKSWIFARQSLSEYRSMCQISYKFVCASRTASLF